MRRPPLTATLFVSWLVSEVAALFLVVEAIGWTGALGLALLTSLLGLVILRRLGIGAARSLKQAIEGAPFSNGRIFDGILTALGAVFLVMPGFVSDLVGFALAAPSVRLWIARRFQTASPTWPRGNRAVLDLSAEDWRAIDAAAALGDRRLP